MVLHRLRRDERIWLLANMADLTGSSEDELKQEPDKGLLHRLIRLVFDGDAALIDEIISLYAKPATPEEIAPIDEDMRDSLEEMVVTDPVSGSDLTEWKNELDKKQRDWFSQMRGKDRKKRLLAAVERRKKAIIRAGMRSRKR